MKTVISTLIMLFAISSMAQNLFAPANLTYENEENNVTLFWEEPDTVVSSTLSYTAGDYYTTLGLTDEGSFTVAARWEPSQLVGYNGSVITHVSLFLGSTNTSYTLKIWEGENAENLLYSQDIDSIVVNQFFDVYLDAPLAVNTGSELWVGYEITQPEYEYPAGIDDGPAVPGFSDLIYFEGEWTSLAEYGFDANWGIIVNVDFNNKSPLYTGSPQDNNDLIVSGGSLQMSENKIFANQTKAGMASIPVGYNVYRNDEMLNDSLIISTTFQDNDLEDGSYTYAVTAVYDEGESQPAEVSVYIGDLMFAIVPEQIVDTLNINQSKEYVITLTNTQNIDIDWFTDSHYDWLYLYPSSGTLQAGASTDLWLYVYSYYGAQDSISAELEFKELTQDLPLAFLPVDIAMVSGPFLSVWPEHVSFGDVNLHDEPGMHFSISNYGADTLVVDSITVSSETVILEMEWPLELAPHDLINGQVAIQADELGELQEEIIIYSNDIADPVKQIPVTAYVNLPQPLYLLSDVDSFNVELSWEMPFSFDENWTGWSSDRNLFSLGFEEEGTFYVGARWFPEDLVDLAGESISRVAFFPTGQNSTYTVHLWQGDENSDPWISQEVTDYQAYIWNTVDLDLDLQINAEEQLWVVIEIDNALWESPMGIDEGPGVENRGDLVYTAEGWQTLSEHGFSYNWNIQFFSTPDQAGITAPLLSNTVNFESSLKINNMLQKENRVKEQLKSSANLLGFNVYRDNVQLNDSLLTTKNYLDQNVEPGFYAYGVSAVYDLGESPQTQSHVQVGSYTMVFDPPAINDTIPANEVATFIVNVSNTGNLDLEFYYFYYYEYLVEVTPQSGIIAPGETIELEITIDPAYLHEDNYYTNLIFQVVGGNLYEYIYYPFEIVIDDNEGTVQVNTTELDFGFTLPGNQVTRFIELENASSESASVEGVSTSMTEIFFSTTSAFEIGAGEVFQIPVYFYPQEVGEYTDEVAIQVSGLEDITVPVFGSAVNAPPMALSASADSNNVYLNWLSPDGISESLLQYADDEVNSAIGYPSDEGFSASALFTNQELMNYEGKTLTHIGFVPYSDNADFTLKIWGSSDEELIYEQEITDYAIQEWNDIALDEPITITGMDQLRIGYSVVHSSLVFPAGIDAGPAVAGKGDLISLDGTTWQSISDIYDLSNNFMIRGFVQGSDSTVLMLSNNNQFGNRSSQSVLLGYNVYRNGNQLNEDLVTVTEYSDENLLPGTYVYEVTALYDNGESPAAGPVEITIDEPMSLPPGWMANETGMVHSIFIDNTDARISGNSLMEEGDLIGLFFPHNDQEVIAGVMQWTNHDTLKIIAYGDDPATTIKEGFENNELMHWRLYKYSTGNTHHLQVEYDHNMPQYDGKFNMLGKSMVKSMSVETTSVNEVLADKIKLYPVPAREFVNISGLESNSKISLINAQGMVLRHLQSISEEVVTIDLNGLSGFYILKIESSAGVVNKPLIMQ